MLLKDYFPNLNKKYQKVSFKGIAFNSRKIKKGYIFFAFKGNNTDGNLFIKDAIQNGSKIIIKKFICCKFYMSKNKGCHRGK